MLYCLIRIEKRDALVNVYIDIFSTLSSALRKKISLLNEYKDCEITETKTESIVKTKEKEIIIKIVERPLNL